MGPQPLEGRRLRPGRDDDGAHLLAEAFVGHGDDRHLVDQRMVMSPASTSVAHHRRVVEAPELARHDADPGVDAIEDEADLAAPQDRDDRVGDRPDADAGEVQRRDLPPVRQLEAHDLAGGHVQLDQAGGEALGEARQLAVGHDLLFTAGDAMGDDRHLVGLTGGVAGELLPERHRSSGLMTGSRPVSTASR